MATEFAIDSIIALVMAFLAVLAGCSERPEANELADDDQAVEGRFAVDASGVRTAEVIDREDGPVTVLVEGEPVGGEYERVWQPVFSPGGESVAFPAYRDGQWFVVRDGEPVGGRYDGGDRPVFCPDGERLAFAAWEDGEGFVVADGRAVSRRFDWVGTPVFCPDGSSIAFAAERDGEAFVLVDGRQVGDRYDEVRSPVFCPVDGWVLFAAREGDAWFVVRDGSPWGVRYPLGAMGWIEHLAAGPAGQSAAFVVRRETEYFVVWDFARVAGHYTAVGPPVFDPSGRNLAFAAARSEDDWVLVVNGAELDVERGATRIQDVVFAPSGDVLACWVQVGGKWFVYRSGELRPEPYDAPVALRASPEDGRLVIVGLRGGAVRRETVEW